MSAKSSITLFVKTINEFVDVQKKCKLNMTDSDINEFTDITWNTKSLDATMYNGDGSIIHLESGIPLTEKELISLNALLIKLFARIGISFQCL